MIERKHYYPPAQAVFMATHTVRNTISNGVWYEEQ